MSNGVGVAEEEIDCLKEGAATRSHNNLDRVEVSLTAKATCEVGAGINRSVEFGAYGAEEAQEALTELVGDIERGANQRINWDLVTQIAKVCVGNSIHTPSVYFLREVLRLEARDSARSRASFRRKDSSTTILRTSAL